MSWSAGRGHEEFVELLLNLGPLIANLKNIYDWTPLSLAAGNGHEKVVQFFLERDDVDKDTEDNHGRTATIWAMEHGRDATVQLLKEATSSGWRSLSGSASDEFHCK